MPSVTQTCCLKICPLRHGASFNPSIVFKNLVKNGEKSVISLEWPDHFLWHGVYWLEMMRLLWKKAGAYIISNLQAACWRKEQVLIISMLKDKTYSDRLPLLQLSSFAIGVTEATLFYCIKYLTTLVQTFPPSSPTPIPPPWDISSSYLNPIQDWIVDLITLIGYLMTGTICLLL